MSDSAHLGSWLHFGSGIFCPDWSLVQQSIMGSSWMVEEREGPVSPSNPL